MTKPKIGRPPKYNSEIHDKMALRYGLSAMTDDQIACAIDIDVSTLNRWKEEHDSFRESLKEGRTDADGHIVQSLYAKAKTGDTTAQIFWLKNRKRREWRDRQEIDLDVSQAEKLSYPELILKLEELKKELEE
jgi:hypothetical protein